MADMNEVYDALRAADAAGRTDDVRKLVAYIESQGAQQEVKAPAQTISQQKDAYAKTASGMPWYEQALAGVGGSMVGTYLGAKQLVGQASPEDVAQYQQASEGLRGTTAGMLGEVGGNIAQFAIPGSAAFKGATKIAPTLMSGGRGLLAPSAVTAGIGATGGAAQGALIPVGEGQSREENIALGGTIGAIAPAATASIFKGAQALGQPIKEAFSKEAIRRRAGSAMAEAAGGAGSKEYEKVIAELRKDRSGQIISKQSAGQAAVEADSAGFSGLQTIANAYRAEPSTKLASAQAAARSNAMKQISRDDPDVVGKEFKVFNAAVDAREKAANRIFGDAYAADDMRINAVRNQLSASKGGIGQVSDTEIPVDPKISFIQDNQIILDTVKQVQRQFPDVGNPLTSLRGLEYLRKALKDDISAASRGQQTALQGVNVAQLGAAKDAVTKAMTDLSPKFAQGIEEYAKRSLPINQMQVGRALHDALSGTIGASEKATVFANKVNAAASLIKRTTGQDRFDKLSKLFNPEQMRIITNVLGELSTDAKLAQLSRAGASEQARKLGIKLSDAKLPNMLNTSVNITNSLLDKVFGYNKNRTMNEIAEVMQDPYQSAYLMENATAKERAALKAILAAEKSVLAGSLATTRGQQQ